MNLPILYSFRRCPYALRARLAILVSGLTVELREVSLANKPAEMLVASPKATIPVMVLPNGQVLQESLDIMFYALEQSDPENWLDHNTSKTVALVGQIDGRFKHHLDRYKYPDRYEDGDPALDRDAGFSILTGLNARLEENRFLAGPTFSFVDAAILPFVRQFEAVDPEWFAAQPAIALQNWLKAFLASDLFAAAMVTKPIWKSGDPITLFSAVS